MTILLAFIIANLILPLMSNKFEKDLEACLTAVMDESFKAKSILVYDARGRKPQLQPKRPLILNFTSLDVNSLVRAVEKSGQRAVSISDDDHAQDKTTSQYKRVRPQSSLFILNGDTATNWIQTSAVFEKIKESEFWNRQGNTILLTLATNPSSNKDQIGTIMIGAHWRWNKAVNVLAIVADRDTFYMYTWFPYRPPDCSRPSIVQPPYDIWRNGSFQFGKQLFPEKIKPNLEACELTIVTAECYPYTFFLENDEGFGAWQGFELSLFNTLAEHFNFTVKKATLPENENIFMVVNEEGMPAGAMGALDRLEADFAYSCLMVNQERYNLAEPLPPYFHDSLTWFTPTPDHKSHVSNVFEAFPQDYWLMIFGTTVAAMGCFFLIAKVDDYLINSGPPTTLVGASLRVFAMALSSPFTMASKNLRLRAFTFVFAMYSLHITTIYQASLYNLYRSNTFINVYHSFQECVDKNLFVWLRGSTKDMYDEKEDPLWARVKQPGRFGYIASNPFPVFKQTAEEKSAVFLYIKSSMLGIIKELYMDKHRQPKIWYLEEQFASYPVTGYMSQGHPIAGMMTQTIQNILGSGLMEHWLNEVVEYEREAASNYVSNVSLKLEHITGAFMFYAALISLAVGFFIIEVIYWLTHGKKVKIAMGEKERSIRRQMVFRAVVDISKDHIAATRLGRFRSRTRKHSES